MVLRIRRNKENRIFKAYLAAMFLLMAVRYLLRVDVPAIAFLLVAMLPIWWGTTSEQLAFIASCIPLSIAYQYKYAILILSVAILTKNKWRMKASGVFIAVMVMMVWELWHAFYGLFSYVEYLRGFAELILLGVITSIELRDVDHKLVIRSLAVSVVGVCVMMLIMQMQQYDFNLASVFERSAKSFRFGQSNMESGTYALNFNANNLGFICNLTTCGSLLLVVRREHSRMDIVLAVMASVFTLMTMSRAAIVCMVIILGAFVLLSNGKFIRKVMNGTGLLVVAVVGLILMQVFVPKVFENILERFQRADVWNGRGDLLKYYNQFLLSSPAYFLFGIGMQNIYEKVSPYFPVHDVPHNGIQEFWVAWGIVGLVMMGILLWKILTSSRRYADGKRHMYQFVPLGLTVLFTMSGQFLTSSRALLALSISYVCLCIKHAAHHLQT